jgi:tetratricopeptide (TPR) repeat protein
MALNRPKLIRLLTPLIAFAATFAAIVMVNSSSSPPRAPSADGADTGRGRSTDVRIRSYEAALQADPGNANGWTLLGNAYLQKARETKDPAHQDRAERAFRRTLNLAPSNAGALAGLGTLANSKHEFARGLRFARRSLESAPGVARTYGVVVDALLELGRYEAAERSLQRMVDVKPNLDSYARVSYVRELRGDLDGAIAAMRLAASAGGEAPENYAYVQTLLGTLELHRGHVDAAERAYRSALARYPAFRPARTGLARTAAAKGDLDLAIRRYEAAVTQGADPADLTALGELELAAGRNDAARVHIAKAVRGEREVVATGAPDADTVLLEANHGRPQAAVRLGRRVGAALPSVRSADALGWALTRSGRPRQGLVWAERALGLGSKDALFLYHAGIAARDAGRAIPARRYLERSLALDTRFSPLYAPRARRALEGLR